MSPTFLRSEEKTTTEKRADPVVFAKGEEMNSTLAGFNPRYSSANTLGFTNMFRSQFEGDAIGHTERRQQAGKQNSRKGDHARILVSGGPVTTK